MTFIRVKQNLKIHLHTISKASKEQELNIQKAKHTVVYADFIKILPLQDRSYFILLP